MDEEGWRIMTLLKVLTHSQKFMKSVLKMCLKEINPGSFLMVIFGQWLVGRIFHKSLFVTDLGEHPLTM